VAAKCDRHRDVVIELGAQGDQRVRGRRSFARQPDPEVCGSPPLAHGETFNQLAQVGVERGGIARAVSASSGPVGTGR
jgi:hypothetical protein